MSIPRQRGRLAAEEKQHFTACPYEKGTAAYNDWIDGWWQTVQKRKTKPQETPLVGSKQ